MSQIFAFTGKKQSGKSTASTYIQNKTNAVRVNFKDALIREIQKNFPQLIEAILSKLNATDWDGMNPWTFERLVKEKPPLFRALLQNYGTEVRRADNPDYWVNEWKVTANLHPRVICDDVRFLNEAQAVKDMGGLVIRIERYDMESADQHSSETEMDLIVPDLTIAVKTGDFDSLYNELNKLVPTDSTPIRNYVTHTLASTAEV